jgi:peptidoglycan/LPS O-acetylase OafA/YrhL
VSTITDTASSPIRPPRIVGHQDSLDGLRAIAALAVLVTHVAAQTGFSYTGSPASWIASRGDVGVPIFFALSGLLLFRPWAMAALGGASAPDVRTYGIRRVLRIVPVYWVVVAFAMITLNRAHAGSPGAWAQYLFFVQIYDPHPWWLGSGAPGLAQMWSLAVEASFYVLLPLIGIALIALARRGEADVATRARRLLVAIAVLAAISYGFLALTYYPTLLLWLDATLPRALTWFAGGMAIAVLSCWANLEPADDGRMRAFCRAVASSGTACALIAMFAFALASTPLAGPEAFEISSLWQIEIKTALYTIIAMAVVAPAAFGDGTPTRLTAVLGNRVMRFLGRISYGVFLWQFLVLIGFFNLLNLKDPFHGGRYSTLGSAALLIAITVLSIVIAAIGYDVVERPAQQLYPQIRAALLGGEDRGKQAADDKQAQQLGTGIPQAGDGGATYALAPQTRADPLADRSRDKEQRD